MNTQGGPRCHTEEPTAIADARSRKAHDLWLVLRAAGCAAADVAALDDDGWRNAAAATGRRPDVPSEATRARVAELLAVSDAIDRATPGEIDSWLADDFHGADDPLTAVFRRR